MSIHTEEPENGDPLYPDSHDLDKREDIMKWYKSAEGKRQIASAKKSFESLTGSERYIKAIKAYDDNEAIRKALEEEGKTDPRIQRCIENLTDPTQEWHRNRDKFFDELKTKIQQEEDRIDRIEHHNELIKKLQRSIIHNGLMNQDRVRDKLKQHGLFKLEDGRYVQRVYNPKMLELITENIEDHLLHTLLAICNSPAQDEKRIMDAEPSGKNMINVNELPEREAILYLVGSKKQAMKSLVPFIPEISNDVIRLDTQDQFHIQFENRLIIVDKHGFGPATDNIVKYAMPDKYINRQHTGFKQTVDGTLTMAVEFLRRAIAGAEVERTEDNPYGVSQLVRQTIGYLLYGVKFESDGYIICLVDETPDASKGGGSGKNIFCRLINEWAKVLTIDARSIKAGDGSYLQALKDQRILLIDEVPNRFDYSMLKSMTNSDVTIKRLYQDKYVLEAKNAPKMITTSNFAPKGIALDGGLKRRIRLLEFTSFFNDNNQLRDYFGCGIWPEAFTANDYMQIDEFFLRCVNEYINNNFKIQKTVPSRGLIEKSMSGSEEVMEFVEKYWPEFIVGDFVETEINQKAGIPYSEKQLEAIKENRQGCTALKRLSNLIYNYSNINPTNPLPKEWKIGLVIDTIVNYASARNYDVIKRYNLSVNQEQVPCMKIFKANDQKK